MLTLGQFIAFKRQSLGYKKMEFAELIGVGDDSLRSWERDIFIPAGKNMIALIKVLKLTRAEIKHYFRTELYG